MASLTAFAGEITKLGDVPVDWTSPDGFGRLAGTPNEIKNALAGFNVSSGTFSFPKASLKRLKAKELVSVQIDGKWATFAAGAVSASDF